MIGNLRERWEYTWADIWEPLGSLPQSPYDLYSQLYRTSVDYFRRRPNPQELAEIVNSPEVALSAFQSIQGRQFRDEMAVVQFLERAHGLINDFGSRILVRRYGEYVSKFLKKYNLRYETAEPFTLRVRLPALYGDIYEQLRRVNATNPHLLQLMSDFEISFSAFVRTRAQRDLTTAIHRASNYAEGIAAAALNTQGSDMNSLCDRLTNPPYRVWPHTAVKQVVKDLYRFCSDYPAIRHAGTPNSRLRNLEVKDTIIVSALFFAASGYLHQQVSLNDVVE
ncbi:MAG: hypothetical protein KJZ77_11780 [Anaerolineales bacterium]|nr:hypothetical protein [Anaerolineales bacterium]